MAEPVVEGTWEEIARQASRFSGRRVRLTLLPAEELQTDSEEAPFYLRATPEEFQRVFDTVAAKTRHLPVLPPEAFERESLYAEDSEAQ